MAASTHRTSELGRRVRVLRNARGWSRATLGREAGVSEATVARVELYGAEITPSLVNLRKLAAALEVAPGELLDADTEAAS